MTSGRGLEESQSSQQPKFPNEKDEMGSSKRMQGGTQDLTSGDIYVLPSTEDKVQPTGWAWENNILDGSRSAINTDRNVVCSGDKNKWSSEPRLSPSRLNEIRTHTLRSGLVTRDMTTIHEAEGSLSMNGPIARAINNLRFEANGISTSRDGQFIEGVANGHRSMDSSAPFRDINHTLAIFTNSPTRETLRPEGPRRVNHSMSENSKRTREIQRHMSEAISKLDEYMKSRKHSELDIIGARGAGQSPTDRVSPNVPDSIKPPEKGKLKVDSDSPRSTAAGPSSEDYHELTGCKKEHRFSRMDKERLPQTIKEQLLPGHRNRKRPVSSQLSFEQWGGLGRRGQNTDSTPPSNKDTSLRNALPDDGPYATTGSRFMNSSIDVPEAPRRLPTESLHFSAQSKGSADRPKKAIADLKSSAVGGQRGQSDDDGFRGVNDANGNGEFVLRRWEGVTNIASAKDPSSSWKDKDKEVTGANSLCDRKEQGKERHMHRNNEHERLHPESATLEVERKAKSNHVDNGLEKPAEVLKGTPLILPAALSLDDEAGIEALGPILDDLGTWLDSVPADDQGKELTSGLEIPMDDLSDLERGSAREI